MNFDSVTQSGVAKFIGTNIVQIIFGVALLLNWWGHKEGESSAVTVMLAQHGRDISELKTDLKSQAVVTQDIRDKVTTLIAIANEQHKK